MQNSRQFVVIMAGGGGTRLWPHSRRSRPKQFLPMLPGGETLLGATVRRTIGLVPLSSTLVVTTAEQVAEVRRCLPDLPIENILVEPLGRNTAACIGLAATFVLGRCADAVMAVLPADHYVEDEVSFARLLSQALSVASSGQVVTLGVRPTHAETGYGYIRLGQPSPSDGDGVFLGDAFVEKPSAERAAEYLAAGNYLWNSGMFFFPAARILAELRQHLPPLADVLSRIADHPEQTAVLYPEAPAISIDYAVMEKLGAALIGPERAIRVVGGNFGWNDVGSFAAVGSLVSADDQGNRVIASDGSDLPHQLIDAGNNIIWSSSGQVVSVIGVTDLVIAVTDDAILVLPRHRAQDVRDVVSSLKEGGRSDLL
jgi:mannose-1-phosphate guanylyltransferase